MSRHYVVVWVIGTMLLPPELIFASSGGGVGDPPAASSPDAPPTKPVEECCNGQKKARNKKRREDDASCKPCPDCGCEGGSSAGDAASPAQSCDPVYLRYGTSYEQLADLQLSGPAFSWSLARSYSSGGTGFSMLGNKWLSSVGDKYLLPDGSDIFLQLNAISKRKFTGGSLTPPDNNDVTLTHDSGNQQYILVDKHSTMRLTFHDMTVTNTLHRGRLKEESTLEWKAQSKAGFEYSYNSDGTISQITSPDGQDYNIVFTWSGILITKVEIKDASNNVLEKAEYTYYQDVTSPSTDIGTTDDLVQVKVSRRSTSDTSSQSIVRYTQYRYDADSNLKAVYEHDAIQRILAEVGGLATPEAILSEDDTFGTPDIKNFANRSFEYYASDVSTASINTAFAAGENMHFRYGLSENVEAGKVKSETIGGCGACGTTGSVKKNYYYLGNDLSGTSTNQNVVTQVVIVDTVNASGTGKDRSIYGMNDAGILLRQAEIQDPEGSAQFWCESWTMATTGKAFRVAEHRLPSAHNVTTYGDVAEFLDPFNGTTWHEDDILSDEGVTYVFEYNSKGMRTGSLVKRTPTSTTPDYIWAAEFGDGDDDSGGEDAANEELIISEWSFPEAGNSTAGGKQTIYEYDFWDAEDRQIKRIEATLPQVPTSQNGSNVATHTFQYFDQFGRLRWTKDGEGYVNYYSYNPRTGGLAYEAIDVDPASMVGDVTSGSSNWDAWTVGDADGNKPTRGSGLPTVLNLVSKTVYDDQGRVRQTLDPSNIRTYTVYENERTITFPSWDTTTNTTRLPLQIRKLTTGGGQPSELIDVKAGYANVSVTSSAPFGFSTEPSQSDYTSWTRYTYEATNGRVKFADEYFDIPSSGTGTLSTNFYRTAVQFDSFGRKEYTIDVLRGSTASDRVEQVTQAVYDARDRVVEVKMGVSGDSAANSHNMTDDYNSYPTMRTVNKVAYDGGGMGDGHVTKAMNYFGTGTNDFTGVNYRNTWRGHTRGIEPFYMNGSTETTIGPFTVLDLNWYGETKASALFNPAPDWTQIIRNDAGSDYGGYAGSSLVSTNRLTRNDILFDNLEREYQTRQYKISSSTGTGSDYLAKQFYYDRNGRMVASAPDFGAATEMAYDGAGRLYQTRTVLAVESTKYSSGKFQYRSPTPHPARASMTSGDDWLLEMTHQEFSSVGNVIATHTYEDNHDDAVSATRGIDVTANDDYVRRSVYRWYDSANRLSATADYGSGDTTAGIGTWKYATVPSRPGSAPSSSSESVLVSKYEYNADTARFETVTDPAGFKTKSFYDDLGRELYTAENWDNFAVSGETGTGDGSDKSKDRVTKFVYDGPGRLKQLVAMDANADGTLSDNQTTTYLYEDAVDSSRATNEIYPDSSDSTSSGSDQVKLEYNIDGSLKKRTDQRGTVLDYTYTNRRQPEMLQASTLGGSTDGHVRAIKGSYDSQSRLEKITSTANSDGTGTVRNEIQYAYNDFSQPITVYQSHEGAVNTMSTLKVQYTYDATASSNVFSRNHRLESVIYPSGRTVFHDYDTSNTDYPSNRLSRVRNIRNTNVSGTIFAQYSYSGADRLAIADLQEPDIKLDYYQGTVSTYAGRDRFGRVKDQFWDGYGSTADVDRIKYASNYAGSRICRDIDASIYATNTKDQAWIYDGLHRLKTHDEGTLSGTSIAGTPAKEQDWSLDLLGNWSNFVTKTAGTTDLNQTRTTNAVNEITGITESTGTAWIDPAYDAAGNMTTIPKPANLVAGFTGTYDAWNRLVKLEETVGMATNIVAEYEYDGANQRIIKSIYASGSLDHRQHSYFNEDWQTIEVRKEVGGTEDADPLEQYVWQPYYVDALILRDYDSATSGTQTRYYHAQDANFNVTTVTNSSGAVQERYQYSPYGQLAVLDGNFAADADGISDMANSVTFSGRELDAETGLYHYRNRFYHGQSGLFISRDPEGYIGSKWNLSEYVSGRPNDALDPLGLDPSTSSDYYGGATAGPRKCIFTLSSSNPSDNALWDQDANLLHLESNSHGAFQPGVTNPETIPAMIRSKRCCEVVLLGHRGGPNSPSGMTIQQKPKSGKIGVVHIFPRPIGNNDRDDIAEKIGNAMGANKRDGSCKTCSIQVNTCSHPTQGDADDDIWKNVAAKTKCDVFKNQGLFLPKHHTLRPELNGRGRPHNDPNHPGGPDWELRNPMYKPYYYSR